MKYKRTQKRSKQMWQRVEKFSIRKFSFGAASCLIGASLVGAAGTVQPVEAAISTFRDQKGGNVTTLYANKGDNPFESGGSGVYDKVNVDQEIGIEIDWSEYSKTNPYVTVTYKYNGGYGTAALNNYGGGRPDFWFTTPVGVSEPKTITLYNLNTDKTGRTITSWSGEQGWVSFSNSVGSRYQNKEMADKLGVGDPTKWERYNDATGEEGRTYRGDLNTMFWRRIGDNIEGSPSEQGIYQSFRDNTKSMYSDWQKAADPTATIKATYKVVDPTLKNGKLVLEFGAGVKVGHGGSLVTHFKTLTVEVPVLYQDSELFEVKVPQRTGVVNTQELTETEKADIKSKILKENEDNISSAIPVTSNNKFKDNLKDGENSIVIGNDGTATITYLDGSKDTIPGTSLVYEKPQIDNNETTNGSVGDYTYKKNPYPVKDIDNIEDTEIAAALEKFYKINGMMVAAREDGSSHIIQVITSVTEQGTSTNFVDKYIEVSRNKDSTYGAGFITHADDTPTGTIIPKGDLFKQKPAKEFSAAEAIEKAKQAIDHLTYLSPKEKRAFKDELASKMTQDDINDVVNRAIAKNSENEAGLEAKKREIKDKINSAKYLTDAEKKTFLDSVNNQEITDPADGSSDPALEHTKKLLDQIGRDVDAKNLEEAKKQAKAEIEKIKDDLTNPTADNYKEQIQAADSTDAVEKIVENAKNQKASKDKEKEKQKADALKDEYKKKIDQIPGLSEADKTEYKKQIEAATSKNQLDNIIKDAEAKATRNKAIETITNLPHLNNAQKADLIEQVKDATDKEEIEDVVTKAQGLDAKMDSLQQLVTKANDVKNTDKYTNATSGTKTSFDTALTNADAVANKETGKEADASEVDSLIDKLKEAIKNLTGEEVAKPVSKAALQAEVNKEAEVHKSTAYLKDTKAKQDEYDKALNEAKTVLADDGASQESIDAALDKLQKARAELAGQAADFTLAVKDGAAKISVVPKAGDSLPEKDQPTVKAKLTANGKELDDTYTVKYGEIAEKGGKTVVPVTVTHDGITRTVDVPVEGTDAAKSPLNDPEKVKVNNVANLSEDEKAAVKAAVKKANPNLTDTQISVDNTGKVTVTYSDKSQNELPASKTVEAKTEAEKALDKAKEKAKADLTEAANKEKAEIDADKNLTDQQKADKKAEVDNVKKAQEANIDKAKTPEEVAKATEEGKKAIDAVHKTELDKAKEKAKADLTEAANKEKAEIDADKNLTDQQKADKKAEVDNVKKAQEANIDKAKTPEEVAKATDEGKKAIDEVHQTELDKAKEKAKADLTDAANKEKSEIDADTKLSKDEKDKAKAKVDEVKKAAEDKIGKATTPEDVTKATEDGKKAIEGVHQTDADKSTPTVTSGEVPVSVDPATDKKVAEADKKAITNAVEVPKDQPQPTDKQVKNDGSIVEGTGANAGKKVVVVEVTYPDGSKDEIEVPVRKTTDKEKAKADLTDAANTEKGEIGGDTTLTDKEKEDLKAKVDEVKKAAEDKINNAKTPEEIAKATEEVKKAIADVYNPQTAKGKSTSIFKPELDLQTALVSGKVTVEKGKDLTDEDILKQLALADGVTAKVISKPTTTETGTKEAEVEVTLADGTKVTVKVSVEVVASLDTADKDNDLAKAKEDAKKQVEDAAKKKLDEIKKDKDLTEDQKQKAEKEINKAKDEAKKAIDEASSAGTAKQIADQAKENIEKYDPKADAEVKKPDVTNLDEEKAKAKAEILEEAQKRIDEIKNNKDLSDEAKQKAIEEINKAKDKAIEDINKGQSKDEINAAKEAGIHKINEVQPDGSIASKFEPKVPENKVEVENPAKLSDEEREQVRQNIEGANTFPDGTTVEVKPDGTAVITYKDGSSDTISKDKLVTPANKETGTIASRTEPVIPGKTQVGNTTKLTPEEQAAVKKAVEEANNFPAGTTVEVRPDGTVVITYPDKSVDTITGDKLVEKGSKQETPKVQTDAEKNPAQVPGNFVPVENTHNLTQTEQDTVAAKVKEANPAATDVKVSKDGTATLTYGDGSVNTIPGTSLVVAKDTDNEVATQAAQNPAVVPATTEVGNAHNLTPEEQVAVATKVKQANPTATDVKVSKDGTATLTYSDGSVNTIPGTSLVVQKEETSTQEQPTIAEKTKVIIPANPTKVAEATRLTDEEKEAVKKAVVDANGFGSDVKVEVAGDGTATIVFKDGSAITIPGNQLVAQDPKAQDSTKPTAEKSTVKAPAQRVDVKDITHLTDEEKEKVKVAILQANGSALDGATINVAGDGTATITFPDGSVVTILGKDTVQQSAKGESVTQEATPEYKPETTPGGDKGGNTGSSDANANAGGQANTGSQNTAQSQASKQLAAEKESAKKAIEKAAKDKQDEIKGSPLSDKEKAELLARVEAEKQAALKEIENAKTVEDVKEAETIGVQAIAMVTVPKRPVAPNAAPQATSAPQATAGTMQDVTYQSPARKQLPNTGSASSAALASLGLVAATSGFALLGRKARRRK